MSDLQSLSSLSSLSSVSTGAAGGCNRCGFGTPGQPCSWLMPVIVGLGIILAVVLLYYWSNGDENYRRRRRRDVEEVVVIQEQLANGQPSQPGQPAAALKNDGHIEDILPQHIKAHSEKGFDFVLAIVSKNCGWCTKLKPELQKAAANSNLKVFTIQAENLGELAQALGVDGFPMLIRFKGGRVQKKHSGYADVQRLLAFINSD